MLAKSSITSQLWKIKILPFKFRTPDCAGLNKITNDSMETIKTIFNSPVYQYDFFSGSGLNDDVTWGHTVRKLKRNNFIINCNFEDTNEWFNFSFSPKRINQKDGHWLECY